jgi:O-antigen/teichoic acid export membrane protein
MPHAAGLFLLSSVDRFVINAELGLEQVGIYMVAVQLVAAMGLVFDAINNAYVPWLFERLQRNQTDEKRQIVRWTYGYCLALLCVVMFAFTIGPPLLVFIAGEKYRAAGQVVGWLALGQAFHGMYLMVTNYIFFSKRTGLLSVATITSGLINVGLLLLLISFMGIKGAAIAFAISMACKFLLTWYVAQLRHPMPWFDFRLSV